VQEEEKTQTIYGVEKTVSVSLKILAQAKQSHDGCGDLTLPSVIMTNEPIRNAYLGLLKRGIKTRLITEITENNIAYCKELMNIVYELRHLEGIKVNFSVSESDYVAQAIQQQQEQGRRAISQLIHSNARVMIEQQQYFFETLWNKAIPAEQRITEIEKGVKPEVIETIREPEQLQERVFELLTSAKEEVLIIFSTANAFRRQEKAGGIDLLRRTAKSKDLKIRVLSPIDDYIRKITDEMKRKDKIRIEIRNIEEPLQTKISVLIVDRTSLLSAELKRDSKKTVPEAIGLAIYSNSKPTVLSYVSIFESLWNQTELYEETRQLYQQLKSHDKMQKEFMDLTAHELRTPIQPILGLTQLLKNQISDSTQSTFLDVIFRNAKRLEQLQKDILDVTRIESGSIQIYKESFNLNELIFDVLQDFRTLLKDNPKIRLDYKSDGDVWVVADKNRIMQVISNLLTNAIKFTNAGRILVQLRMKKRSKKIVDSNQVIVSIKDEGLGIDPSMLPRLFTKFASKSEKGTGLGLFISKSIIDAHGGKIWAENNRKSRRKSRGKDDKDRGGAIFAFSLPVKLVP
jgi:two-component system, OmpR family, sensor histidine kinase VicK